MASEVQRINDKRLKVEVKRTLIELLLYGAFLITSCSVAYGNSGSSLYYFSNMLSRVLVQKSFQSDLRTEINFNSLTMIREFWEFAETVLMDIFYDGVDSSKVLNENILMGTVRFRQLRVGNDSCNVHYLFENLFQDCYDYFSSSSESQNSFESGVGSAWTYHSADEIEGALTWGKFQMYPGGGFYQDLKGTRNESLLMIQSLHEDGWINRGTRAVFIEFTLYNPNLNLFCVTKLIAEILPSGGVITSPSFAILKLLKFITPLDFILFGFEIAYVIQIIAYSWKEVRQITRYGRRYLIRFWNIIDLSILLIAYLVIGFSIFRIYHVSEKIDQFKQNPKQFVNFDVISFWQMLFLDALGLSTFLTWIKMIKYMTFNQTLLVFRNTLARCAKDILGFTFMFFIVFVAYAQLGLILFGTVMYDFRTFLDGIITLMRTILGDFDYLAIERADRVLGPIYFMTYIFFVLFVLLNMFLAIINNTYTEVKSEKPPQSLPLAKYIKECFMNMFNKVLNRKKKVSWSETAQSETNNIETIFFDEMRSNVDDEPEKSVKNECLKCIKHEEEIVRLNERTSALETAVDHFATRFNEFIQKLE